MDRALSGDRQGPGKACLASEALLDGEIAFVLPSGLTSFKSLQEHIDTLHSSFRYFLFDLLSLDGKDWRDKPLL